MLESPITQARKAAAVGAKGRFVSRDISANSVKNLEAICGRFEESNTPQQPLSLAAFTAELAFNAINYSYWGKTHNDRPGGSSSTIRVSVFEACGLPPYPTNTTITQPADQLTWSLNHLANRIGSTAIPLASERSEHLREIARGMDAAETLWRRVLADECDPHRELNFLSANFPGFAEDIFFKRGFLFAALMQRVYGRALNFSAAVPLPADYQVPKVLRAAGVLVYSDDLAARVDSGFHIQAGEAEETEIRASAILAVQMLANRFGTTEAQIDDWLWCARDNAPGSFHLTRTTWY